MCSCILMWVWKLLQSRNMPLNFVWSSREVHKKLLKYCGKCMLMTQWKEPHFTDGLTCSRMVERYWRISSVEDDRVRHEPRCLSTQPMSLCKKTARYLWFNRMTECFKKYCSFDSLEKSLNKTSISLLRTTFPDSQTTGTLQCYV